MPGKTSQGGRGNKNASLEGISGNAVGRSIRGIGCVNKEIAIKRTAQAKEMSIIGAAGIIFDEISI